MVIRVINNHCLMITDFLSGFVLFFMSDFFLFGIILFGFYYLRSEFFIKAASLMFFTMVINAYLKQHFQIPLNPELFKSGFAYPSGHTSSNVVFWGALAIQYRKKSLTLLIITLLVCGFISMVHVGYHDWPDVFGGICLGLIILVLSRYITSPLSKLSIHALCIGLAIPSLIAMFSLFPNMAAKYNWLWHTQGIILSIALVSFLTSNFQKLELKPDLAFLNFILGVTISYAFKTQLTSSDSISGFLLGFCLGISCLYITPKTTQYLYQKLKK